MAPRAATDGSRLPVIDIEVRRLEGDGDFLKTGTVSTRKAAPGERLEWSEALPASATVLRVAAVAIQGKRRSVQTPIVSLVVQAQPPAPSQLTARSSGAGVSLSWTAPDPMPMQYVAPTPAPAPSPGVRPSPAPGLPHAGPPSGGPPPSPPPGAAQAGAPPPPKPEPEPTAAPGNATGPIPEPSPSPSATPTPAPPKPGGFLVYRRSEPGSYGGSLSAPVEAASYADPTATLGTTVCYVVRTVISTDPLIESADSNEACLKVEDVTAPSAPSGVTALAVENGIEVSWSPSPEPDVVRYRIYRAVRGGAPERLAEIAKPAAVYRDVSAKSAERYRYTITVLDAAGNESPPSNAAEGSWP